MEAPDGNLIAGSWCASRTGETFASVRAVGGAALARFPRSLAADVDDAVRAATGAAPAWTGLAREERADRLQRCAGALAAARGAAIDAVVAETGSERSVAEHEVDDGLDGWARDDASGPQAVAAVITSWHRPFSVPLRLLSRALSAGATVVFKPSEDAALSGALLAAAVAEHLPPGVLNLVHGTGEEAGMALVDHPDVGWVLFAGSRDVAVAIETTCRASGKEADVETLSERASGIDIA